MWSTERVVEVELLSPKIWKTKLAEVSRGSAESKSWTF